MNQAIEDFFTSEINQTISSTINEKVLTNQYTDTGARVMNLWIKDGLLDDDRSASQTRHKFSMVEAVWVSIIEELREIGLEKEKIKKVKTQLLVSIEGVDSRYPYLEFHLICSILYKRPFFILIDKDGNSNIVGLDNYVAILQTENLSGHIVFSLETLFQKLISKIDQSKWTFTEIFRLSKEELELLAFIKMNNFQTVKIVRRNGEIDRLEGVEKINSEKRIVDILNEGDYQNIELKQEDGKVVCIHRTVKRKL